VTTSSGLAGVSCSGTTVCIAVGANRIRAGRVAPLAERWNGTSWRIQSTPNPGNVQYLEATSCSAPTACTAVGYMQLAERWNGAAWSVQSIP
jgi:hypothetical protein